MDSPNSQLTSEERDVLEKITAAWNAYIQLPSLQVVGTVHNADFAAHTRELQRIVMSRPESRAIQWDVPKA